MEDTHNVPVFLTKLFNIVQNNSEQEILRFDESGRILVLEDEDRLQSYLLPEYFGHKNLPSFLRQITYQVDNSICMDLKRDTTMECWNLNINTSGEMERQFLNQIKRRNEIDAIPPLPDQVEISASLEKLKSTQSDLQTMVQNVAAQNLLIMNVIMHQQNVCIMQEKKMAETSSINFMKFAQLSEKIQQVMNMFSMDSEIEASLSYQRREAQKGLEYILEDTGK